MKEIRNSMNRTGSNGVALFLLLALGCSGTKNNVPTVVSATNGAVAEQSVSVNAIPNGFTTVTPYLTVGNVEEAITQYQAALGATLRTTLPGPDGKPMHAEIQIGDSILMIGSEDPQMGTTSPITLGGTPVSIHLYVPDASASFDRAVAAGAKAVMPVTPMFWGDKFGIVSGPQGHQWAFASRIEKLSSEQIDERVKEYIAGKKIDIVPQEGIGPVPEGYATVTLSLVEQDASAAIAYYQRAFGAKELYRSTMPNGKILHAVLQIGTSRIMLSDEMIEQGAKGPKTIGGTPVSAYIYVPDADGVFEKAVAASGQIKVPIADMFWGDRYGHIVDPQGHEWGIATQKQDLSPEQVLANMKKQFGEQQITPALQKN